MAVLECTITRTGIEREMAIPRARCLQRIDYLTLVCLSLLPFDFDWRKASYAASARCLPARPARRLLLWYGLYCNHLF